MVSMGKTESTDNLRGSTTIKSNARARAWSMNFNEYDFDDIEKLENSNEMVENTIQTLKNLTNDFELHHELVTNGLLECVRKYIYVFLSVAKQSNPEGINEVQEGINLLVMSSGAL